MNGPNRPVPIAPKPTGPAFKIAMTALVVFLLVQLAAVGLHYLPGLRDLIIDLSTSQAKAEPTPVPAKNSLKSQKSLMRGPTRPSWKRSRGLSS